MTTGLAFTAYTREGWEMLRLCADDWREIGDYETAATEIEAMRHERVELLILDEKAVIRMAAWCRENGHKVDADGRVAFIFHMARVMNPVGTA